MFKIDLRSHKSIYEQIIDGFKEMIMTGALACEEKMPSVRELSKGLGVNPKHDRQGVPGAGTTGVYLYSHGCGDLRGRQEKHHRRSG